MNRKTIGWTGLTAIAAGYVATNWPEHGFLYAVALLALMATMFVVVMICLWLIANDAESGATASHEGGEIYGDYPYVGNMEGATHASRLKASGLTN